MNARSQVNQKDGAWDLMRAIPEKVNQVLSPRFLFSLSFPFFTLQNASSLQRLYRQDDEILIS